MSRKISDSVDGGLSGGSSVPRPGSEDPHHNDDNVNQTAFVSENEDIISKDLPRGPDSEEEECDTCERIFKNNNELNEHQTNDNCGFECKFCGEHFRYENDLELHQKKKCI